jgi:hypothetical protein
MKGPGILARTMSVPRVRKKGTPPWQYHPRSDHHSKVACWGVLFDLLQYSPLLRQHVESGKVAFGINHVMTNFVNGKRKSLDLVLCQPKAGGVPPKRDRSFRDLVQDYGIELTTDEQGILASFPDLRPRAVGAVRIALEAKAAMTEFAKARPRLYAELENSYVTVHADTNEAIAAGLALINGASTFVSPTANPCITYGAPLKVTSHNQPLQLDLTVKHIGALPRRADTKVSGFDALAVIAIRCTNDNKSPVEVLTGEPAPGANHVLHYDSMINRLVGWYASRFPMG